MTRDEHMTWCKARALAELTGDEMKYLDEAWANMVTGLESHPETAGHSCIKLGYQLLATKSLTTKDQMAKFINDFA